MRSFLLPALAVLPCLAAAAQAEEKSLTPYLDELKSQMKDKGEAPRSDVPDPYIQSIRKRLDEKKADETGPPSVNYIDWLKEHELKKRQDDSESYTEKERSRLGPGNQDSAIAALKEGRSELHAKREGEIHHAAGFRYGASINRDISAGSSLQSFGSIYGSNYAPDLSFFYEYQPWHSEWLGNVALFSNLGLGYSHGAGAFQFALSKPAALGGGSFGTVSNTNFQFFDVPVTVGLNYRFNLLRLLRPYIEAGPSLVLYYEGRNDGADGHRGFSKGFFVEGGVSILLDWLSGQSTWDLYAEHGVKHYYLTIDYSRLTPISSEVSIAVSGVYAGLTFEF